MLSNVRSSDLVFSKKKKHAVCVWSRQPGDYFMSLYAKKKFWEITKRSRSKDLHLFFNTWSKYCNLIYMSFWLKFRSTELWDYTKRNLFANQTKSYPIGIFSVTIITISVRRTRRTSVGRSALMISFTKTRSTKPNFESSNKYWTW